jgi:hypothetical protein
LDSINRRDPTADLSAWAGLRVVPIGFHTGTRHGWGTYMDNHHFHCLFVKTLAYLTDGGARRWWHGGHPRQPSADLARAADDRGRARRRAAKLPGPGQGRLRAALSGIARAHSTTAIRSDNERVILVCGYTPPMMQAWPGNEISPEFVASLPEAMRPLISASESWHWRRHVED